MEESQLRYAVAGVVLILMVWMAGRSVMLRRSGVPVVQLGAKGNRSQRALIALGAILDIYLLARAPYPALDRWVGASASPSGLLALAILLVASIFIIIAQGGMGRSWRVGVPSDDGDVEQMVTGGLNRISRNPIYLGIMVFLFGAALAAPGPLTLAAIVISFAGLSAIISSEEKYLHERFGDEYDEYARRVRRWI
ncbi:MAG: isoprenylcysteine carboxylmethyltransferase family protein [Parvularculaceae bacterium]